MLLAYFKLLGYKNNQISETKAIIFFNNDTNQKMGCNSSTYLCIIKNIPILDAYFKTVS